MKGTHNILIKQNYNHYTESYLYLLLCASKSFRKSLEINQLKYTSLWLWKTLLITFTNLKGIVLVLLSFIF